MTQSPSVSPSFLPSINKSAPDGKRWRCGYPPEENDEREAPTCLRIKPRKTGSNSTVFREPEGPLCLFGGEPFHQPPMWCYVDPSASQYKSYYLWWSPCTTCGGTAWRLDEDREDDRSKFKSPAEDPGPDGFPGDLWYRWTDKSEWSTDIDMSIVPCNLEECWVDDSGSYVPAVQTSGEGNPNDGSSPTGGGSIFFWIIIIVVGAGCCCFSLFACKSQSPDARRGRNGRRRGIFSGGRNPYGGGNYRIPDRSQSNSPVGNSSDRTLNSKDEEGCSGDFQNADSSSKK